MGKHTESKRKRKYEHRAFLWSLKRKPCADCKGTFHPWQMEFDHLDLSKKKHNVAMMMEHSIKSILKEAEKCEVVCSNCHRHRTYIERQAKTGCLRLI